MALIAVMEDDAGTRMLVAAVLRKDGHEVLEADNGADGLAMIQARTPDLVISDVQMPRLDGFALLTAMRQDARLATLPVILLTSLQERAHMRIGMTSGADDYLTKPFRPAELREAVAAQLNRRAVREAAQSMAVDSAVQSALEQQRHDLAKLYEQRLASELSDRWPSDGDGPVAEKFDVATVLFVDMLNHAAFAERLSSEELTEVVRSFYGNVGDTVHLFGARHLQFVGSGLLSIFADAADTRSVNHGLRAARAALGLIDSAIRVRQYLKGRFPGRQLPKFEVGIALHSGPVALARLEDPLRLVEAQLIPVGDTVHATLLLQRQASAVGWGIVASVNMLRHVTGAVTVGARALVPMPGRSAPLDAAELLGLSP